ncbi:RHS repeat-associated core domain-containing protein [Chryseobacterium culicis]|uniref:RHS repeat-associated core domain-containing protein n=1 Tax=Chryseobacterium culicis TaxID=680127 RepID=UPI0039778CC4
MDTNNYYPFGLNHISNSFINSGFGSFYSYKYNGKELQESGMYDYGARTYMPDLGRWGVTDPFAEAFRRFSPYHYAADNPVMFIDPDGMRSVPYEGGPSTNVSEGSWWFAGVNGNFTPEYVEKGGLGKRNGGGATPKTFGETQAYRDIMVYLAGPRTEYFKGINFAEFSSDEGGPGDKEKSQQKVTLSGKSKNFTGKFSISYDYEVKDGKTIVSDIKMHTNLNDKWSPLDSWSENVNGSMEEEPIYTVRGNYIFFETYGTLKLLDFSFSKNGVSGGFSIFEFPYKFTGYVNVNDPSNSNVHIKAIKP